MSGAGRRGNIGRWADWLDRDEDEAASDIPESSTWSSKAHWEAPIEHWASHFSEELAIAWHLLKDHCEMQGLPFLENATFNDFVEFTFSTSSKHIPEQHL